MKNLEQFKTLIKKMAKKDGEGKALEVITNLHKNNLIPEKVWGELNPWIKNEFFGMQKWGLRPLSHK